MFLINDLMENNVNSDTFKKQNGTSPRNVLRVAPNLYKKKSF